jgi:hypothetical protein
LTGPQANIFLVGIEKCHPESLPQVNWPPRLIFYSEPNGATVMKRNKKFITETIAPPFSVAPGVLL